MIVPILRSLARLAFRRALAGPGGRGWLAVGVAAMTLQVIHRRSSVPKASLIEKLEPGHSLVITHIPRPGRKS